MPNVVGWPNPFNPLPDPGPKKPRPFVPTFPPVEAPPIEPGAEPAPPPIPVPEPPAKPPVEPPEEPPVEPVAPPEPKPPAIPEPEPEPEPEPPLTPRTEPPVFTPIPGEPVPPPGAPGGPLPQPRKPRQQPGTVPDFAILAALIIAYGLAAMAAALAQFLNWLIFQFFPPSIARKIKPIPTQHITKAITSALGSYEQAFDSDIGNNFHKFAGVLNRLGAAIVAVAQLEVTLAHRITRAETHAAHQQTELHHIAGTVETVKHQVKHVGARVTTEHHRATTVERRLRKHIQTVEHYEHHVLEPQIKRVNARVTKTNHKVETTNHRVSKLEKMLTLAGVTALVSAGLHRLGTDYIRCDANKELGRANCGVGRDFWRKILGDALDALIVADLCEIMQGMTYVAEGFVPVLKGFVDVEQALLRCPSADYPKDLILTPLQLPTPMNPLTLTWH